jgi:hypothetical protein
MQLNTKTIAVSIENYQLLKIWEKLEIASMM